RCWRNLDVEQRRQQWREPGPVRRRRRNDVGDVRTREIAVFVHDTEQGAQRIAQREVWRRGRVRLTLDPHDRARVAAGQLRDDPALAGAAVALDDDHRAVAVAGPRVRVAQAREFVVAADERQRRYFDIAHTARVAHRVRLHRLGLALDEERL